MGAHGSKEEKLSRSYSDRFIHNQVIERERFGSFGKRAKGAAKKRDVRNLSISPTDLGPPPKTQQTGHGAATRPKPAKATLKPKKNGELYPASASRMAIVAAATAAATAAQQTGLNSVNGCQQDSTNVACNKRFAILNSRRLQAKASDAAVKDRIATTTTTKTTTQQQQQLSTASNEPGNDEVISNDSLDPPATAATQNRRPSAENVLITQECNNNNNSKKKKNVSDPATPTTTTTTVRSDSGKSSSVLNEECIIRINKKANGTIVLQPTTTTTATATATTLSKVGKKSSAKSFSKQRSSALEPQQDEEEQKKKKKGSKPQSTCLELQNIAGNMQLERRRRQQEHLYKSMDAMGALLQYVMFDLDAFGCSAAKAERNRLRAEVAKTVRQLEEARSICFDLEDKLRGKDSLFKLREEELQKTHHCELEKAQRNLSEMQLLSNDQIEALRSELKAKETKHEQFVECLRQEIEEKLAQKQEALVSAEHRENQLRERVAELEWNEKKQGEGQRFELENRLAIKQQQLLILEEREKVLRKRNTELETSDINLRANMKTLEENSAQRERELLEKVRVAKEELEFMRETKEIHEREFKEQLSLLHEESFALRVASHSDKSEVVSSPPRRSAADAKEITRLEKEVESLRSVLELKQEEMTKMQRRNNELQQAANDRLALCGRISTMEARIEMLQTEAEIKSEKEKNFQRQVDTMEKSLSHETLKRTQIARDKESLQWQLRQRCEQLQMIQGKLHELSAQEASFNSLSPFLRSRNHCSSFLSGQGDADLSPPASPIAKALMDKPSSPSTMALTEIPTSPVVKALIEKPASVSWVLELETETPQEAVQKMMKRAGSLRWQERSPAASRKSSLTTNPASRSAKGPNPLAQSMSATAAIFRHSSEAGDVSGSTSTRHRSQSMSAKSVDPTPSMNNKKSPTKKKLQQPKSNPKVTSRQNILVPPPRKELMRTSSPVGRRPRSSTVKSAEKKEAFHRASARKLITCDTSALNSGQRLEPHSLPTHPSLHDLKAPPKSPQVQESAGEAMVSGANSEDEGCSHSSDEVVSSMTASTSSAASASSDSSSLNHAKDNQQQMSFEEEALLLVNSLNATPMDVSWCDEAPMAANGSSD